MVIWFTINCYLLFYFFSKIKILHKIKIKKKKKYYIWIIADLLAWPYVMLTNFQELSWQAKEVRKLENFSLFSFCNTYGNLNTWDLVYCLIIFLSHAHIYSWVIFQKVTPMVIINVHGLWGEIALYVNMRHILNDQQKAKSSYLTRTYKTFKKIKKG